MSFTEYSLVITGKVAQRFKNPRKAFRHDTAAASSSCINSWKWQLVREEGLVVVEAYALGYVGPAQRAVLQGIATHLTAAHMTTRQEDHLRLQRQERQWVISTLKPSFRLSWFSPSWISHQHFLFPLHPCRWRLLLPKYLTVEKM